MPQQRKFHASVEGMMVYRKDNNKLYVQGDKKMNALAEEKKVRLTLKKIFKKALLYLIAKLYITIIYPLNYFLVTLHCDDAK